MRQMTKLAALGVTGLLTLVACGGSGSDSPTVGAAQTASTTTTVAVATTSGSTATTGSAATTPTTAAAPAATTVSANNASQADIQKALEAAGVSNAARWAVEVVEYRPYPTNDPTFAKLRQNLAKYNPAPGLVDQIISALSL